MLQCIFYSYCRVSEYAVVSLLADAGGMSFVTRKAGLACGSTVSLLPTSTADSAVEFSCSGVDSA